MDSSRVLKASSLSISYASSIHIQQSTPVATVMEVSFSGSSSPAKKMRCPVGLQTISSGAVLLSKYFSAPSLRIAHFSSANAERSRLR